MRERWRVSLKKGTNQQQGVVKGTQDGVLLSVTRGFKHSILSGSPIPKQNHKFAGPHGIPFFTNNGIT